jgi:hypothetical protein
LTTVNLAGEVRLHVDVLVLGPIDALTSDDVEIVAVGAIATQFELRMPWMRMRERSAPVHRRGLVDVDVAAALFAQHLERVPAAGCRAPRPPLYDV